MFGPGTTELFGNMPSLEGLDAESAKRMLSSAYIDILTLQSSAIRTSGPSRDAVIDYIRRLASTLESYAIFDQQIEGEVRSGGAFVAAESLAFLLKLSSSSHLGQEATDSERVNDYILKQIIQVESCLLFLVAGFEINATTLLSNEIQDLSNLPQVNPEILFMNWAVKILIALCRLDYNEARLSAPGDPSDYLTDSLVTGVRAALWLRIGMAAQQYMGWLSGGEYADYERAVSHLNDVQRVLSRADASQHADIYHLCRVTSAAINSTHLRAVRNIPSPSEAANDLYTSYILSRTRGTRNRRPRPLLWPPAHEYVQRCLPGPRTHAVVSVPTGSGKGFLAEIAVSQGLISGWSLYLVPTNSLASQVRRDLEQAFSGLEGVQVRAFLGGDEYTTLGEEYISTVSDGSVVVVTPEKCALALRMSPAAFSSCRVCIFDECHLLSDGTRGVLAELVISHIASIATNCHFVLMSAMMSNPEDISDWLSSATGIPSTVIRNPWRPTRTMRSVAGLDYTDTRQSLRNAQNSLQENASRVNMPFDAPLTIAANVQGSWAYAEEDDFALIKLPASTTINCTRRNGNYYINTSGWVNRAAASLSEFWCLKGFPTLTFIPSNKHHCFSVASKLNFPEEIVRCRQQNIVVDSLLTIAEDELGVPSLVRILLQGRIAVHTSALLDAEKTASEISFQEGQALAMFATGTLAQGLNLPASVVIISGTTIGDRRASNTPAAQQKARSQLLNALGRAGRAGFANHGLSIVITEQPIYFQRPSDATRALQSASFMAEDDDSTTLDSRLLSFVDAVLDGDFDIETATTEELVAFSYLPMDGTPNAGDASSRDILKNSFAIFKRSTLGNDHAEHVATALASLGQDYVQRVGAPDWIKDIAYKTGLPFLLCLRFFQALGSAFDFHNERPNTITGWKEILFRGLSHLPPQRAREILGNSLRFDTLAVLWDHRIIGDEPSWTPPQSWLDAWDILKLSVTMYTDGEQISTIARLLLSLDNNEEITHNRSATDPIPKVIAFINKVLLNFSRLAGCLVAIDEAIHSDIYPPEDIAYRHALSNLPLAIRYGCSSDSVLAWYRFGIRYRRPAHMLAQAFPLPEEILRDSEKLRWIIRKKRDWLSESDGARPAGPTNQVLDAVHTLFNAHVEN